MTIGQRIAQKRKELALSQEALGEELGVSRQSIYKWESDAALPEIDKLIALSKRFGVSVGALLGVEDISEAPPASAVPETDGELSEAQLKMVEEIVARYLAAQPKPAKRKRWPAAVAVLLLLIVGISLFNRLEQLNEQYNNLQNSVSSVQSSVNAQISGISNRVEEILKAQNSLTAEYGTEMAAMDLGHNTVTFSLRATPKTYTEGMSAVFVADSGSGPEEFPAALAPGRAFTGEAAVELTDSITLSVVFINPDGTRQTQLLDTYTYLYSETLPWVSVQDDLWRAELTEEGVLEIPSPYNSLRYAYFHPDFSNQYGVTVADARMGLFKNQKLEAWGTPCAKPDNYHGFEDCSFFEFSPMELTLTEGDTVCFAAVLTDQYGRTFVIPGSLCTPETEEDGAIYLTYVNGKNPTEWDYE